MRNAVAFFCGLVFGLGLLISGMSNPQKVLNFLDLAGTWDPSLAFVMAAAVAVTAAGYHFVFRRAKPVLADEFSLPGNGRIDARLLTGAALFGIGWGLVGFCPGPAVVALPFLNPNALIFFAAMLAGMLAARRIP